MTVNDITLRSQQFVEGARQFQDQRRDQANANIGNTIQGVGNMIVDTARYEREFAMKQQALQQELAMQQADSSMRLALQQQELQSNQYKLQQMAAIDAVDMSREQLRSMKLENDSREYSLQQQKKMAEPEMDIRMQEAKARFISALGGARGAISFGIDPLTGRKFASHGEQEAAMQRAEQLYGRDGGVDAETLARRNITQSVGAIDRLENMILMEEDPARKAQLQAMQDDLVRRASPAGAGQPKADTSQQVTQKSVDEVAKKLVGARVGPANVGAHPLEGGLGSMEFAIPEKSRVSVAKYLVDNIDALVSKRQSGFDKDPSRKRIKTDRQETLDYYISVLNNPGNPLHADLVARLRAGGVIQ